MREARERELQQDCSRSFWCIARHSLPRPLLVSPAFVVRAQCSIGHYIRPCETTAQSVPVNETTGAPTLAPYPFKRASQRLPLPPIDALAQYYYSPEGRTNDLTPFDQPSPLVFLPSPKFPPSTSQTTLFDSNFNHLELRTPDLGSNQSDTSSKAYLPGSNDLLNEVYARVSFLFRDPHRGFQLAGKSVSH